MNFCIENEIFIEEVNVEEEHEQSTESFGFDVAHF